MTNNVCLVTCGVEKGRQINFKSKFDDGNNVSDLLNLTKNREDIKQMISEQEKNGLVLELYSPEHMDEGFNTFVRIEMTEMLKPGGHYRFRFEEKVRINCIFIVCV